MTLPSTKPYLVRAIYEWCCDNGFTPYMAVAVDASTQVPREFVKDGQIVLNIDPGATNRLNISNEFVDFQARFGGHSQEIVIPMAAVLAIYAKENGKGMVFGQEDSAGGEVPPPEPPAGAPKPGKPRLQVVK